MKTEDKNLLIFYISAFCFLLFMNLAYSVNPLSRITKIGIPFGTVINIVIVFYIISFISMIIYLIYSEKLYPDLRNDDKIESIENISKRNNMYDLLLLLCIFILISSFFGTITILPQIIFISNIYLTFLIILYLVFMVFAIRMSYIFVEKNYPNYFFVSEKGISLKYKTKKELISWRRIEDISKTKINGKNYWGIILKNGDKKRLPLIKKDVNYINSIFKKIKNEEKLKKKINTHSS